MDRVAVDDPRVLVLVEGDTPSAVSNSAGHLFEIFVGQLLARYGYQEPTAGNVNVSSRGIELDLSVRHRLTQQLALVECKAYTSPIRAPQLNQFYGKLTTARFDDPDVQGFFVALPRLVPQGREQAELMMSRDNKFRAITAQGVVEALRDQRVIADSPSPLRLPSDPAVIVSAHGIYSAAIELDPSTRTAQRVVVWSASGSPVPSAVLELLLANADYGGGIPVVDQGDRAGPSAQLGSTRQHDLEPVVTTVNGSTEDFEYQLPASPRFFVGRAHLIAQLEDLVRRRTSVIVLNAQSGWGKSSLALRLQQVVADAHGHALIVDARTANPRSYLTAVLRRAGLEAEEHGLAALPTDSSWATLASALGTIARAEWAEGAGPLVVFFDQFENVFKDYGLTREFRDLALGARDIGGRFIVGFAWKTDLVGWTEGHPYQLRDEIRANASVLTLDPLGAREVETLLRRLEKRVGEPLLADLRRRLREYSQGLPWLLKKLASHVIRELSSGVTQEELLNEALNVQGLFEADLAELQPSEQEALRFVARFAPVSATEAMERFQAGIVQSLLDRRLLVQVGERLDTYWDTFRDFLNTGRVPIEDSYILRQTPRSVARLWQAVGDTGDAAVPEIASRLKTSENAVFNLSRELRLMGVTEPESNRVRMSQEIWRAPNREEALRRRVLGALRRHRAFTTFNGLAERTGSGVTLASYARVLPEAFPAVEVSAKTWTSYARAFLQWFEYAGLVRLEGQGAVLLQDSDQEDSKTALLSIRPKPRVKGAVGQQAPGPAIAVLSRLAAVGSVESSSLTKPQVRGLRDLVVLGVARQEADGAITLVRDDLFVDQEVSAPVLRELLEAQPGFSSAFSLLEAEPSASPARVGALVRDAYGAEWSEATTMATGKYVRAWARHAGIPTVLRR